MDDNISLGLNKNNSDTIPVKKPIKKKFAKTKKISNKNITPIKNNKNIEFHLLDFDAIFEDIIIGKKKSMAKKVHKSSHIKRNKNKIKLIGSKRIRLLSTKNSIKKRKYIYLFSIIISLLLFL